MTGKDPFIAPTQAVHLSGKNGRNLVSVFVWADDTFQVVDETGGRAVVIDTHRSKAEAPAAQPKTTLEAFS